jgi:uroporphyrinogen-III synthase
VRVLVTRVAAQGEPLVEALRREGFEPVPCPLIEVEPIGDDPIDAGGYDWVIVTSANGAEELAKRRLGELPRVAAIGNATAAALRRHGIAPDFVPSVSTQEGLVEEFPQPVGRALFVAAEGARGVIASRLAADVHAVYRTRALKPDALPNADVAVVASPSAARALAAVTVELPVVSIGPHTSAAARDAGLTLVAEAAAPTTSALVAAVRDATG